MVVVYSTIYCTSPFHDLACYEDDCLRKGKSQVLKEIKKGKFIRAMY